MQLTTKDSHHQRITDQKTDSSVLTTLDGDESQKGIHQNRNLKS